MASTVTSRRKQLGNELRHARTAAKMTQQQVADVLGCTQGKVNKIESGAVGVKLGDVEAVLAQRTSMSGLEEKAARKRN